MNFYLSHSKSSNQQLYRDLEPESIARTLSALTLHDTVVGNILYANLWIRSFRDLRACWRRVFNGRVQSDKPKMKRSTRSTQFTGGRVDGAVDWLSDWPTFASRKTPHLRAGDIVITRGGNERFANPSFRLFISFDQRISIFIFARYLLLRDRQIDRSCLQFI